MELVLDVETHDPNISLGKGAGWVFKDYEVLGYAVKVDDQEPRFITNFEEVKHLVSKARSIICHNAQYDIGSLHRLGIPYKDKTIIDTLLLMKLYDNTLSSYNLDSLAVDILGYRKDTHLLDSLADELKLKGKTMKHMKTLFAHRPDVVAQYAMKDVEITRQIYDWIRRDIYSEALSLIPFYSTLIKALVDCRAKGVRINPVQAEKSGTALEAMYELEIDKFDYYCPNINLESTKQLSEAFRKLGLEPDKTEKGNDSIDSEWRLKQNHPAVSALSKAKKYQKLKRDFIDGILNRSENDRIYPEINILGAAETGRFSSSNPNIQQCFDDQTEILTEKRGFVLFKNLSNSDRVASWKDGEILFTDFSNPVTYVSEYINVFQSKANRINMAVTDDHRCLRMNRDGKLEVYFPKEHYKEWLHLNGGSWNERPVKIFSEFLDLTFAIHALGQINTKRGIDFFLAKTDQISRLVKACRLMGIPIQKISKFATGAVHLFLDIKDIPNAVWRYIDPLTKELTNKAMLFAKPSILDVIRLWYTDENYKNTIYTNSKQTADMFQIIVSLSNAGCTIKEEWHNNKKKYRLTFFDEFYTSTSTAEVKRIPYRGNVFCISVPSTFLLVRRHGATSISGNCPSRDEISNTFVKSIFIPEENETWCSLDFSSQEPRIQLAYAYRTECPGAHILRDSFLHNVQHDLHQQVANICKIERKEAKTINLAISYGMSRLALAEKLNIRANKASEIFKRYNILVPYLHFLNKKVKESALRKGYVKTLLGRRLIINREEPYKALNKLIQGSACDMTAICLVKAYEEKLPVLFSVHDSIELSVSSLEQAKRMKHIMENSFEKQLPIPFYTEIKSGANWGSVKC